MIHRACVILRLLHSTPNRQTPLAGAGFSKCAEADNRNAQNQHYRLFCLCLQDPFDPADCPARAIGTLSKTNNGVGILITYLFCSSQRVFQRYNGSSSTHQSTLDGTISSSTGSADATGGLRSIGSLQDRLCQCLAWLFGPQAVLHLAQHDAAAAAGGVASSIPWRHWAACPFDAQLAEKIQARIQQQRQQQQQSSSHGRSGRVRAETPAIQFRWLINHLRAAVEPEAGPCVLCLEHLQLLNKRIEAGALHGALGAALAATAAGRRAAQHVNRQQLEDARHQWQQRRLPGPPLPQPDEHIVLVFKQLQLTLGSKRWQPKGTGGKKRKPGAACRSSCRESLGLCFMLAQACTVRWMGAALVIETVEAWLELIQAVAHAVFAGLNAGIYVHLPLHCCWCCLPAVENSKAVKDAARHAVTQVALRMLELGTSSSAHRQHADPWEADAEDPAADMFGEAPVASAAAVAEEEEEEADGIGGFGLAAVLEQHGFIPLLQRWDFVDSNGTIWPKLLPLPEHLKPKRGGGAGLAAAEAFVSSSGGMVGAASDLAAAAMHAAADLMHLHSAHVDATADHDSSQPHQQQQQRGTGVFVSSRQFLNKVLQEQQQGQQHQQRKHSHHNQHQQQQARDEHRQQDEGMALQFDMELHTHTTTEGVVTSSSVAVTGMTDNLQHLTVGIDITSHAAGAGGSSSHSQDGAQHTAAQQCNRQQHGKVRAVRHQAELVGFPGYGSTESGGSSGFAAMSSPPAAAQSAGSQGFMSPLGGKPPGRQSKSQQKPQHQQQQQQGSGESAGGSRGGAKAAPVRQSPKLLARRRQYGCSPDAAVASVPIDFEPVGVQGLAMHGDGLAESYCRQLQEKLSSPASTQQPPPVLTHTTQQQQQEVQHPAAILLTSATSGLVTAGSSGSQGMGGFSPPAAAGSYGSASSSHGVTSPLSNKPQLRLQQATYKVKQLQQQISKTKAQVAVRQAEVAQHKKQIHDILGPNGKEYLLAPGDRAVLMEAKNSLMSSEKALKMQQGNLERALQKLPDLQRDLEAAQAAAAAQQAFAP